MSIDFAAERSLHTFRELRGSFAEVTREPMGSRRPPEVDALLRDDVESASNDH